MIDVITDMVPLRRPYVEHNKGCDGADWGHKRGGNAGMKQMSNKIHPLGKHPFNIITEEIYGD